MPPESECPFGLEPGCSVDLNPMNGAAGAEGQVVRKAGGFYARQSPHAFQQLLIELAILRFCVAKAAGVEMRHGNVMRAESRVDGASVEEAPDAESGADQQNKANRDLRNHKAAAQPRAPWTRKLSLILQRRNQVAPCAAQRRHNAKRNPTQKRGNESECKNTPIERGFN